MNVTRSFFLGSLVPLVVFGAAIVSRDLGHAEPSVTMTLGNGQAPPETFAPDAATEPDDRGNAVDFYGNEVTDAIAKYRLNADGGQYELHTPNIEMPRLPSPKS